LDFSKLNSLAQRFFTSGMSDGFDELYREAVRLFRKVNRVRLYQMGFGDDHEADEILDKAIWKLSETQGIRDFGKALSRALKNLRLNFKRDSQRSRDRLPQEWYKLSDGDEEDCEGSANPLIAVEAPPDIYPSLDKKNEDDQKKLVAHIEESAKIHLDPTMTAIIERTKLGEVPYAIGKSLGLQRNTVDRNIRYLARHYNRNLHGDITEYIPEGCRIRREYLTA
jgi:DNA-directed RNA polymerase specialized sigma24 family protein